MANVLIGRRACTPRSYHCGPCCSPYRAVRQKISSGGVMHRMHVAVLAIGVVAVSTMTFAQQPPGRAGEAAVTRPEMLFKEEWKQPFAPGELTEENRREKRRVTQAAVANRTLE